MKFIDNYSNIIGCNNSEEVFDYLISTLKDSITQWDYFINWSKVFGNIDSFEIDLNIMNYLIGKENIELKFRKLLVSHPSIYKILPIFVACRQKKFNILTNFDSGNFIYENFNFKYKNDQVLSEQEIDQAIKFCRGIGIFNLFEERKIKNCVDYLIGVEVGLDSNGRKNRGGHMMEDLVEFYVKELCQKKKLEYIKEATAKRVKEAWDIDLAVDKSNRRIDFIIFDGSKLHLIETNFYTSGGSKLKSTAGEYKSMFDYWTKNGCNFIWITDGKGWINTTRPLEETFNHIDYLLNLDMLSKGLLIETIN